MTNLLLLPLMLLAADGPEDAPLVKFEIRDVYMQGLGWRDALVDRAERVGWVDGVAFWTIDDATLRDVLTEVQGPTRSNVTQAPKLVAREGDLVSYNDFTSRNVVTSLDRVADGPRFEASAVAFQPQVNAIQDGVQLGVSATRDLSDAYVLSVDVCEKQVEAVYTATFEDSVKGGGANAGPARLRGQYQVPRVVKVAAEATCPVPAGRHLLVCLGPRESTVKGKIRSREVLYERFLVITPSGTTDAPTAATVSAPSLPQFPSPLGN